MDNSTIFFGSFTEIVLDSLELLEFSEEDSELSNVSEEELNATEM